MGAVGHAEPVVGVPYPNGLRGVARSIPGYKFMIVSVRWGWPLDKPPAEQFGPCEAAVSVLIRTNRANRMYCGLRLTSVNLLARIQPDPFGGLMSAGGTANERFVEWFEADVIHPIEDFKDPKQGWRRLFSEALGTFFLVLVAVGAG